MNDTEIAWAAGFFDGEGSISCSTDKNGTKMSLTVVQADRGPLDRFNLAIGGCGRMHVRKPTGPISRNPIWALTVKKWRDVAKTVELLWPYLCEPKRRQTKAALEKFDARKLVRGIPDEQRRYAVCPNGHDRTVASNLTPERYCRICRRAGGARYRQRKRDRGAAVRASDSLMQGA